MTDHPSPELSADAVQIAPDSQADRDRQLIVDARAQGKGALFGVFVRLSGPGWLQAAITLGGGSLAGSLYLGVLAGYGMLWWQPMAMILGVIMLSAIGYVVLSTGERPFAAINKHVNPVLGWGWAIAAMMANLVWCMPQFALGTAALRQNLFPALVGDASGLSKDAGILCCVVFLFLAAAGIVWFYDSGGRGIKLFEAILKGMVGVVVVCFFGVVAKLAISGGLDWGAIFSGFVPRPHLLFQPADAFQEILTQAGASADFWRGQIISNQQQVMITAAATAVGINMTFLLPYSMLAKGWDKEFRGLAIFDLGTGLFIPYLLATSCVVIAAIHQFHAQPAPGLVSSAEVQPAANLVGGYEKLLNSRLTDEVGAEAFGRMSDEEKAAARQGLPEADRQLAAMLVQRDAFNLAESLSTLVGKGTAPYVFGIGVLGMAISTIIILMLINGFAVCEMLGLPGQKWPHRIGALMAGVSGALGPFVWKGDAQFWLAVPTSMFGMVLLPIAYWTFYCLFNSKSLMGENRPKGAKLIGWNILMILAAGIATLLCLWSISINPAPTEKYIGLKAPTVGYIALGSFIGLAALVHFLRAKPADQ